MKIFISFASADDKKRKALARVLEGATPPFEPIVVGTRRDPGRPLAEKVAAAIRECDCLVPILTPASVPTQWLNQEIGFATALGKQVVALVDKDITAQLKGFVHNQLDLPFQFTVDGAPNKSRPMRFAAACRFLVEYLDSQPSAPPAAAAVGTEAVGQQVVPLTSRSCSLATTPTTAGCILPRCILASRVW
jgi:hypothetical protein